MENQEKKYREMSEEEFEQEAFDEDYWQGRSQRQMEGNQKVAVWSIIFAISLVLFVGMVKMFMWLGDLIFDLFK